MSEQEHRNRYIDEQLSHAVGFLVSGHGRIKERLRAIGASRVTILRPELFPLDLRGQFSAVYERLTTAEGPEGSVAASIDAMTESEASDVASEILSLLFAHKRYWRDREGQAAVSS